MYMYMQSLHAGSTNIACAIALDVIFLEGMAHLSYFSEAQ